VRTRALVLALAPLLLAPACVQSTDVRPECRAPDDEAVFILAAQAVPSAQLLPCLDSLVAGWDFAGSQIVEGSFRFWLSSDRAGFQAVGVELVASCDISGTVEVLPGVDEVGTRRFEEPLSLEPRFTANRYYRFPGGCVQVEYRFAPGAASTHVLEADQAISFRPREAIVDRLAEEGLVLCGFGAPSCPGGD
jgi:hypothetical protein